MKKIMCLILLLLIPIKVQAISASSYIVMDMDSGRVLEGENIHDERLIASITKIMTAYLALEYGNLNDEIEVGEEILTSFGSSIYLEIGEKITLENLLYGLMLRSGNDAAIVIAHYVSKDMASFAELMNNKAKELGMKNTNFYNSHGLEEKNGSGNTSTAYDMAILTKKAMENKDYQKIVSTKNITVKTNYKTYNWTNKNKLLKTYNWTTGGKTGFTEKARRTLVTTASKDNKNLIIVTLNDGNDFKDHKDLYESYFKNYDLVKILDKENYESLDNYYNKGIYIKNDYSILVKKEEIKNIYLKEILDKEILTDGKVGKIQVYLNGELLHEESLYFKEEKIKEENFLVKIWKKVLSWLT